MIYRHYIDYIAVIVSDISFPYCRHRCHDQAHYYVMRLARDAGSNKARLEQINTVPLRTGRTQTIMSFLARSSLRSAVKRSAARARSFTTEPVPAKKEWILDQEAKEHHAQGYLLSSMILTIFI